MQITIDYVEDKPRAVDVERTGSQIYIKLPDLEIYLYSDTAEALRDALVETLGAPEDYYTHEDAADKVSALDVQSASAENLPDDNADAYRRGYSDALAAALAALEKG